MTRRESGRICAPEQGVVNRPDAFRQRLLIEAGAHFLLGAAGSSARRSRVAERTTKRLDHRIDVAWRKQESRLLVPHDLATPGDVRSDDGQPDGGRFEQHAWHTFAMAGMQ